MVQATRSLYHYTEEFLAVRAALEAADVDETVFHDTLEAYEDTIASKMENVIKYRNELLGLAELQKAEAKKLNEAAKAKEAAAERLKDYMDQTMKAIGSKELQAGAYKLKYRKGSEVVIVDEEKLPDMYWVEQDPVPMSKPELKKLIQAGEEIDGVCLKRNPDTLQIQM